MPEEGPQRAQRLGGGARRREAVRGILRHHARDEGVELGVDVFSLVAHVRSVLEEDLRQHRDEVLTAEWGVPGEARVEYTPEREEVGPAVDQRRRSRLLG